MAAPDFTSSQVASVAPLSLFDFQIDLPPRAISSSVATDVASDIFPAFNNEHSMKEDKMSVLNKHLTDTRDDANQPGSSLKPLVLYSSDDEDDEFLSNLKRPVDTTPQSEHDLQSEHSRQEGTEGLPGDATAPSEATQASVSHDKRERSRNNLMPATLEEDAKPIYENWGIAHVNDIFRNHPTFLPGMWTRPAIKVLAKICLRMDRDVAERALVQIIQERAAARKNHLYPRPRFSVLDGEALLFTCTSTPRVVTRSGGGQSASLCSQRPIKTKSINIMSVQTSAWTQDYLEDLDSDEDWRPERTKRHGLRPRLPQTGTVWTPSPSPPRAAQDKTQRSDIEAQEQRPGATATSTRPQHGHRPSVGSSLAAAAPDTAGGDSLSGESSAGQAILRLGQMYGNFEKSKKQVEEAREAQSQADAEWARVSLKRKRTREEFRAAKRAHLEARHESDIASKSRQDASKQLKEVEKANLGMREELKELMRKLPHVEGIVKAFLDEIGG